MKKVTISCILIFLFLRPFLLLAQNENSSWLSASGGLNSIWIVNQDMYGNQKLDYATKLGLQASMAYSRCFEKTGYSVGLGFMNLGQNYSGVMSEGDASRKVNLYYIQVPVMGMYGFSAFRDKKWILFGPQFMFLLHASQYFSRSGGNPLPFPENMPIGTTDISKRFKPVDVMLAVEIPKVFSFGSGKKLSYFFSVKTAYGLTDINSKDYQIPNSSSVYKASHNFYFGVNLGAMFNRQEH